MVIATKGGFHWDEHGNQTHDASPATLRRECEESLRRLNTDHVELYYLHAPDKNVPLTESAGEMKRLKDEGKVLSLGVSNVNLAQLEEFVGECPIAAFQPPYNMLQSGYRDRYAPLVPQARGFGLGVLAADERAFRRKNPTRQASAIATTGKNILNFKAKSSKKIWNWWKNSA